MWHKGMEQSQNCRERKIHHCQGRSLFGFVLAENFSLGRLNKPVAVIAPDKIIEMLRDQIEVIFAIRGLYRIDCLVEPREHFDGIDRQLLSVDLWRSIARAVHLAKTRNVPEFRRKVSAFLDLSFIKPNILASGRDAHQAESQSVGAVLVYQLERIRRIA